MAHKPAERPDRWTQANDSTGVTKSTGAISGVEAFPSEQLTVMLESNKSINDIDLEETIQCFLERFG